MIALDSGGLALAWVPQPVAHRYPSCIEGVPNKLPLAVAFRQVPKVELCIDQERRNRAVRQSAADGVQRVTSLPRFGREAVQEFSEKSRRSWAYSSLTRWTFGLTSGSPGEGLNCLDRVQEHGRKRVHAFRLVKPVGGLHEPILSLRRKKKKEIERLLQVVRQLQSISAMEVAGLVVVFSGNERYGGQTISRREGVDYMPDGRMVVGDRAVRYIRLVSAIWELYPGVITISDCCGQMPSDAPSE